MDNQILLSICIPTYNFGQFIGETLASIVPQMTSNMEVVIVDGGSKDSTDAVVHEYQKKYPSILYHKLEKRGGIDRDMALSISLASGKYCWLFSSDDVMREGAVKALMEKLEDGVDVYLQGFTISGFDVKTILFKYPMLLDEKEEVIHLSDPEERLKYFRRAINSSAFFSFMSSLVINKARWDSIEIDNRFYGSCWAHVARIFSMIPQGLTIKFLPDTCLYKRSDNDSFMDKGLIHRYAIAIDGYHEIGRAVFGQKSEEAFHLRRIIRNEFPIATLLVAKEEHLKNKDDKKRLNALVRKTYSDLQIMNKLHHHFVYWMPNRMRYVLNSLWRSKRFLTFFIPQSVKQKIKRKLKMGA